MKTLKLCAMLIAILAFAGGQHSKADVVFTFDTAGDTEGWILDPANGGISVGQEFIGGEGYLEIVNGGGFAQTGRLEIGGDPSTALNQEIDLALVNGGTLSFDLLLRADDQVGTFDFFNILVVTQDSQGNGFTIEDFNIGGAGGLAAGQEISTTLSFPIIQGVATNGDGQISFGGLTTDPNFTFRNLLIGGNSGGTSETTFYIDNVRISAVPEPSTLALLLGAVPALLLRRSRS